ncbi:hypothetical protein Vretimale_16789, partial [Volvox reticuliferus]
PKPPPPPLPSPHPERTSLRSLTRGALSTDRAAGVGIMANGRGAMAGDDFARSSTAASAAVVIPNNPTGNWEPAVCRRTAAVPVAEAMAEAMLASGAAGSSRMVTAPPTTTGGRAPAGAAARVGLETVHAWKEDARSRLQLCSFGPQTLLFFSAGGGACSIPRCTLMESSEDWVYTTAVRSF